MKILINDYLHCKEDYISIFNQFGYEKNELIFCTGFQDTKEFIIQHLVQNKLHIDIIITNDSMDDQQEDVLKSAGLRFFLRSLNESYSKGNLKIAAIPLLLYSNHEGRTTRLHGYDGIVQKNSSGDHRHFVFHVEKLIRHWRGKLRSDLELLGIRPSDLVNFPLSRHYKDYRRNILPKAEYYACHKVHVLSLEFLKCPHFLPYNWLIQTAEDIERPLDLYYKTLNDHQKYYKGKNERTVWHRLFMENQQLLKRDAYDGFLHEKQLRQSDKHRKQICDFIRTTQFPKELATNFLEVKREDHRYYSNKKSKRPQFTANFYRSLNQLWDYMRYALNPANEQELCNALRYVTKNFDFTLLAGSKEEKEEMQESFSVDLMDHYPGIQVVSFQEFGESYESYLNKDERVRIQE